MSTEHEASNPSCTRCHHVHVDGLDTICGQGDPTPRTAAERKAAWPTVAGCCCPSTVPFPHYPEVVRAVAALEAIAVELAVSNAIAALDSPKFHGSLTDLGARLHGVLFPTPGGDE